MFTSNDTRTRLYAFGSNGSGQLGVGHFEDLSMPQRCHFVPSPDQNHRREPVDALPRGASISKLVAGGNHTLVLLDDGTVYAAGNNSDGRCCIRPARSTKSTEESLRESCFVEAATASSADLSAQTTCSIEFGVKHIAATWEASFFVRREEPSRVYVCGTGQRGELGLGPDVTQAQELTLVCDVNNEHSMANGNNVGSASSHDDIKCISACVNHVVLLTTNGNVYGWGASRKGHLGEEFKLQKCIWTPSKLAIPFKPVQLATGRDFTFLIGPNGEQAFLGESKYFDLPLQLPASDQVIIYSGWTSIQSLCQSKLTGFGKNDRGQLPAEEIPPIVTFAAGSEHSIALSADGELIAWGWGEHGNCGSPVDSKGNVIGKWNVIDGTDALPNNVLRAGVGAGCATSFFWTTEDERTQIKFLGC